MMSLILLLLANLSFAQDCPSLSGSYRGFCHETRHDGSKYKYDMQYDVHATACKALNIKVTTYPDQWSIQEVYDLEKGLIKVEDNEYTDVMSGGRYFEEGFLGTLLFVHVDGDVDTVLNEYRKSSDGKFLIDQSGFGVKMTCALDPI